MAPALRAAAYLVVTVALLAGTYLAAQQVA
jgi:hypothetical protein